MDEGDRIETLEQALRDERARRRLAETRTEELTARAETWRERAEARSRRIQRIKAEHAAQAERSLIDRIRGRWRRTRERSAGAEPGNGAPGPDARPDREPGDVEPSPGSPVPPPPTRPVFGAPAVRAVVAVDDPGMVRTLDGFDVVGLGSATAAELDGADLVVVEPAAVDPDERRMLARWAGETARARLVVWTTSGAPDALTDLLAPGDVLAATSATGLGDLPAVEGVTPCHLPGCFAPDTHHPAGPLPRRPATGEERCDGARIVTGDGGPIRVEGAGTLLADPPRWLIELAASGVPLADGEPPAAAGHLAHRWAYRNHAPWIRARRLLEIAGIDAPAMLPRVAGILVSHRPRDVPAAITGFLRQTYPDTELVVGLHGSPVTPEIEAVVATAAIPITLLELDRSLSLGACLNRAIDATSAPVLAKIDDDDHYGPAHVEDSVHALAYGDAGIVGKGAQYTYLSHRDTTVLRRPGQEQMPIDGSPNGATLVFRRGVWERTGFPHRPRHVDTGFLRAARATGATVYAGGRWEFCYVRGGEGHTWTADDAVFLAGSEPAWDGFHPERVEVAGGPVV